MHENNCILSGSGHFKSVCVGGEAVLATSFAAFST